MESAGRTFGSDYYKATRVTSIRTRAFRRHPLPSPPDTGAAPRTHHTHAGNAPPRPASPTEPSKPRLRQLQRLHHTLYDDFHTTTRLDVTASRAVQGVQGAHPRPLYDLICSCFFLVAEPAFFGMFTVSTPFLNSQAAWASSQSFFLRRVRWRTRWWGHGMRAGHTLGDVGLPAAA